MIMFELSPANPKNKDQIIVRCEKCLNDRPQLYIVAKRKETHICASCTHQQGAYKTNAMVEYKCAGCGTIKVQKYRPARFKDWRCHHCAMVKGHEEGKFRIMPNRPSQEARKRLSELAADRWKDESYRAKWANTRQSTHEQRRQASINMWKDETRLTRLSESIKSIWQSDDYRSIKTTQSRQLWESEAYKEKHAAGMAKEDARHKMLNARLSQLQRTSNIQEMLYKFLEDLKVDFYKEGERTKIGYYVFDCLIPSKNGGGLLVECQGDYWHTLPRTQRTDKSKFTYIQRYHPEYQIMYVWEHEFYSNGRVLDRIKKSLSIDLEHVEFEYDQIEIKAVEASELRTFLDAYHYIGAGRWGAAFGAYIDGELIGVTVLSDPLRQNMAGQFKSESLVEISRVCIHPSYHKRNFASWFVSRCMKLHGRHDYLAYADSTVGHKGTIYKALGFKLHHEVPSDYWYVDENGFAMHKKTLYNRAVKMSQKESEFAENNGYVKKYGGIKYCYVKNAGR